MHLYVLITLADWHSGTIKSTGPDGADMMCVKVDKY